jgi:hypothetical protein
MSVRTFAVALGLLLAGCGNAAPAAHAPAPNAASSVAASAAASPIAEPPDAELPKLRTGAISPVDDPQVHELHVIGRYASGGVETLAADVPDGALARALSSGGAVSAAIDFPVQPAPIVFLSPPESLAGKGQASPSSATHDVLWIRRALTGPAAPVTGEFFESAGEAGQPGWVRHFRLVGGPPKVAGPEVYRRWLRALATQVMQPLGTPWGSFAASRLLSLAAAGEPATQIGRASPRAGVRAQGDLASFMETTTGETAIQEALQNDRPLFAMVARQRATVPIGSLKLPALASHPWKAMLSHTAAPPVESMASNVPAEFYYARAVDLPSLYDVLDQIDAWGTPAASVLDGAFEEHAVAARYEAALGLRRGPMTRALGPSVVGEVVVVGSDPYLREGSDITVLLKAKNRPLLEAGLAVALADLEREHGAMTHSKRVHGAVEVNVTRSADGAVSQQRASVGDVEVVSNSANAIDLVLETSKAAHPSLADEPDFQFMLARDAGTRADVLAYMGDRFVAAVVGPKQKVLEARRQLALGELTTPGFAALLYGWLQGKSPEKVEDLFSTSLLAKSEMTHANGSPIAWRPGEAARSSWGTPAALTPLIDLPTPDVVTASERTSYEWFARGYESDWSAYIDPIALRMAFTPVDGHRTMTVDVRELPLIDGTQYREVADFVGDARFAPPALSGGVRSVVGIGEDAWPRRELGNTLKGFSPHEIKFDWVGPFASIGLADRTAIASTLLALDPESLPQRPDPRKEHASEEAAMAAIGRLPIYAQIAIKGPAQAAVALAAIRVMANETIPGMFEWGEIERHRGVPLVRIHLKKEAGGLFGEASGIDLFYAVTRDALILTLQDWMLRRLIDEGLDGKGPTASTDPRSPQFSFSLGGEPGKGLWTAIAWLVEEESLRQEQPSANRAIALLRGAPEVAGDPAAQRSLALAYFGAAPLTPDGASFVLTKEGVGDPARGTPSAPVWPDVPVPGSALAKVLQSLTAVRSEIAFDDEGKDGDKGMRSLHARVVVDLR